VTYPIGGYIKKLFPTGTGNIAVRGEFRIHRTLFLFRGCFGEIFDPFCGRPAMSGTEGNPHFRGENLNEA